MNVQYLTAQMPVLALRGLVVFPEQTIHFDVGRPKSVYALEAAMKEDQMIFLVPQKNIVDDNPEYTDLVSLGTVVKIKQILRSQGENIRVLVTGLHRGKIIGTMQEEPYLSGLVEPVYNTRSSDSLRSRVMRREASALYSQYVDTSDRSAQAISLKIFASDNNSFIANLCLYYSEDCLTILYKNMPEILNIDLGNIEE